MTVPGRVHSICYLADGQSIHTQRWAAHFAKRGFQVSVISFRPSSVPGVTVHVVQPPPLPKMVGYLLTLPRIIRLLRTLQPDVVHAHYLTSYGLLGALSKWRPFIVTAWGSDVLIAPRQSLLMRAVVKWVLRKADLVTSMAAHMTELLVVLGVSRDKIMTLPFGVDTTIFHPGLRDRASEDVDVISTRPMEAIYNIGLLIRALSDVAAQYPAINCALLGDGRDRPVLKRLAGHLGLADRIAWTGAVPHGEVAQWLSRARVFVTSSLSDGNNVSLNEAMACGCFPIGTDIAANQEWVTDGQNGFLVPVDRPDLLAKRILQALREPEMRHRAAMQNWEIVQQRADWRKNTARIEQYYNTLGKGVVDGG